jgi:hypothetical protein
LRAANNPLSAYPVHALAVAISWVAVDSTFLECLRCGRCDDLGWAASAAIHFAPVGGPLVRYCPMNASNGAGLHYQELTDPPFRLVFQGEVMAQLVTTNDSAEDAQFHLQLDSLAIDACAFMT